MRRRTFFSRDYQRQKVYDWQYSLEIGANRLPDSEISEMVEEVCFLYGVPENKHPEWMYNSRLKAQSRYCPSTNRIELAPEWGNMALVVLHELVHAIMYQLDIKDCWHGPMFVGMFKDVMEMFLEKPKVNAGVAACRHGVDFIESPH